MVYSSVLAYINGVTFMLKLKGYKPPDISDTMIKMTLSGLKRDDKSSSRKRDPVKLSHLKRIYKSLKCEIDIDLLFWSMCLFLFRTLLRVSHIVSSPHTLRRSDIKLTDWGLIVSIRSSKTDQHGSHPVRIPVNKLSLSDYCPVHWLVRLIKIQGSNHRGPLFALPSLPQVDYNWFATRLRSVVQAAKIKSKITSHSFRKGGATFMSACNVPLADIRSRGGWRSNAIFRYIDEPLSKKKSRDVEICDNIVRGLAFGWSSNQ